MHAARTSIGDGRGRRLRVAAGPSGRSRVVAPSAVSPAQGLFAALFKPQAVLPQAAATPVARGGAVQVGRASYYSGTGHTAAGGHVGAATCAHRSLPFGTKVLVTNLANSRQAVLTVNDRGPFVRGRVLDVSRGAAGMLGMLHAGVSSIRMQVVGGPG